MVVWSLSLSLNQLHSSCRFYFEWLCSSESPLFIFRLDVILRTGLWLIVGFRSVIGHDGFFHSFFPFILFLPCFPSKLFLKEKLKSGFELLCGLNWVLWCGWLSWRWGLWEVIKELKVKPSCAVACIPMRSKMERCQRWIIIQQQDKIAISENQEKETHKAKLPTPSSGISAFYSIRKKCFII